ncbi:MAG TPA: L-glutamate gamma-semialdehyde dehydrogenase [Chloroflexota bacterium]
MLLEGHVQVENRVQAIGEALWTAARSQRPTGRHWWEERLLDWSFHDDTLKTQVFRFIDVLPSLTDDTQLVSHMRAYFGDIGGPVGRLAGPGLRIGAAGPGGTHLVAAVVRSMARRMAGRFIGGVTVEDVLPELRSLWDRHHAFTLHLLGETTVSEAEAERYQRQYLAILDQLAGPVAHWPSDPLLDGSRPLGGVGPSGASSSVPILGPSPAWPRVSLAIKLTSLYSQIDPLDFEGGVAVLEDRVRPILRRAQALDAFIYFDMEQADYKNLVLRVFRDLMLEGEFRDWSGLGIALQGYLRDSERDAADLIEWGRGRTAPITVRLVRGAYWDAETVLAALRHWPAPVFTRKDETDASYERITDQLLSAYPNVQLALGTHNLRSLAVGMATAEALGLPDQALEIQMLYGMADELKAAVVDLGRRARVYVPFGELIPGMAYLVRRLLENTSNESFLRSSSHESVKLADLLRPPSLTVSLPPLTREHGDGRTASMVAERVDGENAMTASTLTVAPYQPLPLADFAQEGERESFRRGLDQVRSRLGRVYPLFIDGKEVTTAKQAPSVNPARPSQVVGYIAQGGRADADAALAAAGRAFRTWRDVAAEQRASYLLRAAELMRQRRYELAGWQVLEVGKNWREADADVAETIDYLEYYAREMLTLGRPIQLGDEPGERNDYFYQPRGIAVVIAPWNFPLAILAGMSTAALVVGNTVIMKPSGQSSVIGAQLMEIFREVGLPPGVLNFVPGPGSEVGAYLVEHPDVAIIAFTGSKDVGNSILTTAAQLRPGQRQLKRVIAEMGGKNAIIIDDDADLDEAITGVVASAFGYQGQKCSACSRTIVVGSIYDEFLDRLVEAARSLKVGSPEDPGVTVGPVIDEAAMTKIRSYIEAGRSEARSALETNVSHLGDGYFVGPTIFADVLPSARIAQEEIFGPVLAVMRARDFDEALEIATNVEYALTGGFYSRNPVHIDQARREFRVGNLYINRKITGAVVGRQPFGGFRMSGIGSKAGGPDYLRQFMEPRTVTENTLRRGFAPEAL